MPRIPPKGKPIAKGERRNPQGSSAKARNRAAVKKLVKMMTPDDLASLTSSLLQGTRADVVNAHNDPARSVIETLTAKFVVECFANPDIQIYRTLIEQVVGRPKERRSVEMSGADGSPIRVETTEMTTEAMAAELAAIRARKKAQGLE